MYAKEIHEAMDTGDLNRVWDLMFKRTAWIQNNTFLADEVSRLSNETIEIRDRLVVVQQEAKEQITRSMLTQHAARAYGSWR